MNKNKSGIIHLLPLILVGVIITGVVAFYVSQNISNTSVEVSDWVLIDKGYLSFKYPPIYELIEYEGMSEGLTILKEKSTEDFANIVIATANKPFNESFPASRNINEYQTEEVGKYKVYKKLNSDSSHLEAVFGDNLHFVGISLSIYDEKVDEKEEIINNIITTFEFK